MARKKIDNEEVETTSSDTSVKKIVKVVKQPMEKKPKAVKEDQYFSKETQEKLEEYKLADTNDERWKIYLTYIKPAFEMLVDKLVSVYNFKSFDDEMDIMKSDCVFYLWETIQKWDGSKGKKAFSYFNVVAKNWLIARSRKNYLQFKRTVVIDDGNNNYTPNTQPKEERAAQQKKYPKINLSTYMIDEASNPEEQMIAEERQQQIYDTINYMCRVVTDHKEKRCIEAIKVVFDNIDSLDFLNKRAVLVYLREISGLNNAELSSALSSIRKVYKQINKDLEEDLFDLF
jgi:hypothetical protein